MSQTHSKQYTTTIVLLSVVVFFFVCLSGVLGAEKSASLLELDVSNPDALLQLDETMMAQLEEELAATGMQSATVDTHYEHDGFEVGTIPTLDEILRSIKSEIPERRRGDRRRSRRKHKSHADKNFDEDEREVEALFPNQPKQGQSSDDRVMMFPSLDNQVSYSGLLPFHPQRAPKCTHEYFYWYFEALNHNPNAPIVMWLQGGPGCSTFMGVFDQPGPLTIDDDLTVRRQKHTWNNKFSLLFVDQPVGVGYSDTSNQKKCTPRTIEQSSSDLYDFLIAFFKKHPDLAKRPFYLAGQSYAGKYIPGLAYKVLTTPNTPLRMDGVAIGDGLVDPKVQTSTQADTAYHFGLINERQRGVAKQMIKAVTEAIDQKRMIAAKWLRMRLFDYLSNASGNIIAQNVAVMSPAKNRRYGHRIYNHKKFFQMPESRSLIHVPAKRAWRTCGRGKPIAYIKKYFVKDIMRSVAYMLPTLFSKTRVMFYEGQFDLRDGLEQIRAVLESIDWPQKKEFLEASRRPWYAGNHIAGTTRTYGNVTNIVLFGAGHMAAFNQPIAAEEMMTRFIENRPWFSVVDKNMSIKKKLGKHRKVPKQVKNNPQASNWLAGVRKFKGQQGQPDAAAEQKQQQQQQQKQQQKQQPKQQQTK
jgi:vitellogenic carboxypeptidase-like protein